MNGKFWSIVVLSLVLVFMVGCGNANNANIINTNESNAAANDTKTTNEANATNEANDAKQNSEAILISYAHSAAVTSNTHKTGVKFKEEVEKRSNGQIKVDVFAQYAGDREILESMQRGDIGATLSSTAPIVLFNKKLAVFDLPFLFPTLETPAATMENVFKVLDTPETQALLGSLDESGLKGMAFMGLGFRELTSNKEVRKIEDLKGLKIRTQENKYHLAAWNALGASPTPMSFSEVFSALEQGTVDGQENPYEITSTSKLYEVQKYLVHTHHIFNTTAFTMSKKIYDSLSDDLKVIVDEASQATVKYSRDLAIADAGAHLETLRSSGMTIVDLSEEESQKLVTATLPVWDQIKQDIGEDVVNSMVKAVESVK